MKGPLYDSPSFRVMVACNVVVPIELTMCAQADLQVGE